MRRIGGGTAISTRQQQRARFGWEAIRYLKPPQLLPRKIQAPMKCNQSKTHLRMTSLKQIEANRRNALKSTGPVTEAGKERSRRNALRHGLTAETVIEQLEDAEDYKAFEISITSDFDAQTAVERELVLRLASVMWRLRRFTAIETGLLQIGKRGSHPRRGGAVSIQSLKDEDLNERRGLASNHRDGFLPRRQNDAEIDWTRSAKREANSELALRFARLGKFDAGTFERLSRYETALWRQAGQLLFALKFLHRPLRRQFFGRSTHPLLPGNGRD
jgi:hypothetical protein